MKNMHGFRDVAIVDHEIWQADGDPRNEIEFLQPVIHSLLERSGLTTEDLGFVVSGSSDYLAGVPFAFLNALDAVGPWPPINESHVEMDGAWALYEAWVRLQHGDVDLALVYAFGSATAGDLPTILSRQMDPYLIAPLWPDAVAIAGLQARVLLEEGHLTTEDMARVVSRDLRSAQGNPLAIRSGDYTVDDLLAGDVVADPFREFDVAPVLDGAVAMLVATSDRARQLTDAPIFVRGMSHCVDAQAFGLRDLRSPSVGLVADELALSSVTIDVAELHAPFASQQVLLEGHLGLEAGVRINPSGGVLCGDAVMTSGLSRIAHVADALGRGDGAVGVGHATSGPCLQQNLMTLLEVDA